MPVPTQRSRGRVNDPRAPLPLRHHAPRRAAEPGRRLLRRGQGAGSPRALDGLGIDYVEGGWPGANPTDSAFFAAPPRLGRARLTAFGMTKRDGRSAANDEVLAAVVNAGTPAVCLVGKTHDFHVDDRARRSRSRRTSPTSAQSIAHLVGARARGAVRRRALLRRLQGEPRLCARLPEGGARRPAPAGWCSATPTAARCRPRSARITARGDRGRHSRRAARHPHPRRHRQRGREHARGRRCRGAAGAGHAERARRALRQRQSRQPDPDAAAEGALCEPLRDRRRARGGSPGSRGSAGCSTTS